MNSGTALNRRVWGLFEKAGFTTAPNSASNDEFAIMLPGGRSRPIDLHATIPDLGVSVIGSNKSGDINTTWTGHMSDLENLRINAKVKKALLITTKHELTSEEIAFAKDLGITVWNEDTLAYFEAVADAIGSYAKYEMIHALGIKTAEERHIHTVYAIKIEQPVKDSVAELYLFTLSPEKLLRTSAIYRRALGDPSAYQRMLKRERLPAIGKFLKRPDAVLPTDIILHLGDEVREDVLDMDRISNLQGQTIRSSNPTQSRYKIVALNIPLSYDSLEIIDGQHRLYGFTHADPKAREDFNLVVVGMRNLSPKKKRDLFIAINDNARRMDPNLVAYLKHTTDDEACEQDAELMAIRIVVDLNKLSPFKKSIRLIDVKTNRNQKLTLKALAGGDLRGLIGSNGALRKINVNNHSTHYVTMLRTYFSLVQNQYKKEWKDSEKYILATNRGITALLKLLKTILKNEPTGIWPSNARLQEYIKALNRGWDTWESAKIAKSYVGTQGYKDFQKDLVAALQKDPKFRDLKV